MQLRVHAQSGEVSVDAPTQADARTKATPRSADVCVRCRHAHTLCARFADEWCAQGARLSIRRDLAHSRASTHARAERGRRAVLGADAQTCVSIDQELTWILEFVAKRAG